MFFETTINLLMINDIFFYFFRTTFLVYLEKLSLLSWFCEFFFFFGFLIIINLLKLFLLNTLYKIYLTPYRTITAKKNYQNQLYLNITSSYYTPFFLYNSYSNSRGIV